MWEKMAKRAVSLETRSYFFFFWTVFSETRPTKLAVFTCYLGIKAWNTVVVFIETRGFCCGGIHWNQGILASPKPLVSMKPPQQNPWFQWNHPRFQVFNPKTRETANFRRPSFTETVPKKKKMSGFLIKTICWKLMVSWVKFGRKWLRNGFLLVELWNLKPMIFTF